MRRKRLLSTIIIALFASTGSVYGAVTDHISPYGNLYLFFGGKYNETYNDGQEKTKDSDLIYRINNNSNLGFKFDYKKYRGVFELGVDDIENDREVVVRKAYGEYNLSSGKLMIGQSWSPYVSFSHEMGDYYRSKGFGSIYEDPNIQIKLTFDGFYFSIMKPYVAVNKYYTEEEVSNPTSTSGVQEYSMEEHSREQTTGLSLENIKSVIPKIAIGYTYHKKDININAGIAGNMYFIENTDDVKFNKSYIYSYLAYVNSEISMGDFSIGFSGGFLVNPANFGIYVQSEGNSTYAGGAASAIENIATGKFEIKDTWNAQGFIEVGYNISPTTLFYLGGGYSVVKYANDGTEYDMAFECYMNCKFNISGLIALTPSVSYRDFMEDMDGNKEGREIYAGVLATVSYY